MEIEAGKFSGHQSFPLRNTWLTKGVRACADDPAVFRAPDALVRLGVGKNMVDAIKYWCLATQMISPSKEARSAFAPSAIGEMLFDAAHGCDPYLENEGTLWLVHWLLVTNASVATTPFFAFCEWNDTRFTRAGLENAIGKLAERMGARATATTVKRDVGVFIRTYSESTAGSRVALEDGLDSPLTDLGLLHESEGEQAYFFSRGPKDSLPDHVLWFALDDYRHMRGDPSTLTFGDLAYAAFSPGRVFKLDEPGLAERLERLGSATGGAWQLTETAGYRQIVVQKDLDAIGLLQDYYAHESAGALYA